CGLLLDGGIMCWGAKGLIGDGSGEDASNPATPKPVAVRGINNAVAVAAGGSHTCARLADDGVMCWGQDNEGQLGDGRLGAMVAAPTPVAVPLGGVVSLAGGNMHTCAALRDGTARCWGNNFESELGSGTMAIASSPTPNNVAGLAR